MKSLKLLIAAALLSATALAFADPPAQVGRLSYLTGTVSFAPAEANSDWGAAPLNRPITTGDRLWADRDGRAEIRIGSTAIRVNALTSLDVLSLDDSGTQLRLAQGSAIVRLRRLDAGEHFEISTPAGAVLLMQPGVYRVSVDPSGAASTVLVQRGQADVLSGNAPISLRDYQSATFSAQGQDITAAAPPDEFDAWAAARDNQEERLVSTRYVPQEMTGYEDLDQHGTWRAEAQYGNVWVPTAMPVGWAPYRYGRWVWISPWGWTWVDNAPWGFAPYHYGRWVWLGSHWAWAPGARVARPVYAPALVAFVGGANWSVGISSGPAVGWVPLGWREPYIPWYRHSPAYVRNVNITHVTNVTVINQYTNVNNVRYINRGVPSGTTVVARDTFVSARHVHDAALNVPAHTLAAARVNHEAPVTRPERHSIAAAQAATRVPAAIAAREVMVARALVAPSRQPQNNPGGTDEHPRVRVLPAPPTAVLRRAPETAAAAPAPVAPVAPVTAPAAPVPSERRERAERNPAAVVPPQPAPRIEQPTPPVQTGTVRAPAPVTSAAPPQVDTQRQQHDQQREARVQARQAQQQQLQEQKERQHQAVQQRAQEVQRQRDQQMQHLQQVEQQKQLQRQQQQERVRVERTERQAQAAPRPAPPPPPHPRPPGEKERDKSQPR